MIDVPSAVSVNDGNGPLPTWARDFARKWNTSAYKTFVVHGNVFDLFPITKAKCGEYGDIKSFFSKRMFPERSSMMFFDVGEGLTFSNPQCRSDFFYWLPTFDSVEGTSFSSGLPKDFAELFPILKRFLKSRIEMNESVTLVVDFAEKVFSNYQQQSPEERGAVVDCLKLISSQEILNADVCIVMLTDSLVELNKDIVRSSRVALVKIDLPDADERESFLQSKNVTEIVGSEGFECRAGMSPGVLAKNTSGMNLVKMSQMIAEVVRGGQKFDFGVVANFKKRVIEDFCGGLVRFKQPKVGLSLDSVATHEKAKAKLRSIAWLISHGKNESLERGILLPGRVGVGKSFIVDCFASECGLPVMELGEFRSKWVGDTEAQLSKVLLTIKALGPVIVVVDEADAVFGNRGDSSGDSGLSGRVFATLAAHIGDSSMRGRELWIAMTSRPDFLAIDMKRQGRFGLSIPLFPAQTEKDVVDLFEVVAKTKKMKLDEISLNYVKDNLKDRQLTGSDVESIIARTIEAAELANRSKDSINVDDIKTAICSFIDPLDPSLLELQELAAVLACSDNRFLPEKYVECDRTALRQKFETLRRLNTK